MSTLSSAALSHGKRAVYRRIDLHVLPLLVCCYLFAYLDRINIGFAKLQMQSDIGISDAAFGVGAGIFFLGYMLFEIPSNLLLPRLGARKTLSRIMVLWGLTSAAMMFVHDVHSFYILRFMLGVFEAGFAPGMVFYLTCWYPQARMAQVMAFVMAAAPLGGIVGAPLSTGIMALLSGAHGLAGWQWMFLLEGLPCVVLGVVTFFCLDDRIESARWLSSDEKASLLQDIGSRKASHAGFRDVCTDGRVYVMAFAYFCLICGIYAVSFWLPTILKSGGVSDLMTIGFLSAIPYGLAVIAMWLIGRSSDKRMERRWHSAVPAMVGAVALAVSAFSIGSLWLSLASITLATALTWAAYTVFWAMPSEHLKGDAAAGGIALINTIGLVGGFISPSIIGWVKSATGSMQTALLPTVALLMAGACVLALIRSKREA
jgi:MFS family permease